MVVMGSGDGITDGQHTVVGILHSDPQSAPLDHQHIIQAVSDRRSPRFFDCLRRSM